MTLKEIVDGLLNIAKKQPNINYVYEGDVYELASVPNLVYSIFAITQSNHTQNENTITYNLNLFYFDRLFKDKSNLLDVQSKAIVQLGNIINRFLNEYDVEVGYTINYTTFQHKIGEVCGGAYCTLSIVCNNNIGLCNY